LILFTQLQATEDSFVTLSKMRGWLRVASARFAASISLEVSGWTGI
jgi:hypothetical protein